MSSNYFSTPKIPIRNNLSSTTSSVYHEPSPHLFRAWPTSTTSLQNDYPSPKAKVPQDPPVLSSSRTSLIWETDAQGNQSFGLSFLLIDLPLKPKSGSQDEKNLQQLKDVGGQIKTGLDNRYFFKPSLDNEEKLGGFGKLGTTYYDLIKVEEEGSDEIIVHQKAGWTYSAEVPDVSEVGSYPKNSLLAKIDPSISKLSFLFGVSPASFPLWFDDSAPLLIATPLNPYKRIFANPSNSRVQIFYFGDEASFTKEPILLAETESSIFCHENGCPLRVYFDRKYLRNSVKLLPENGEAQFTDFVTACPYKGVARYYDLEIQDGERKIPLKNRLWSYPDPTNECLDLKDLVCFWAPGPGLAMIVDGEAVENYTREKVYESKSFSFSLTKRQIYEDENGTCFSGKIKRQEAIERVHGEQK